MNMIIPGNPPPSRVWFEASQIKNPGKVPSMPIANTGFLWGFKGDEDFLNLRPGNPDFT